MQNCCKCNGKRNHVPERVPGAADEIRCMAVCEDCGDRRLCTFNPADVRKEKGV